MPSNFPAPFPRSAIPGATSPKIIRGITNDKKLEKIPVMVTKIFTAQIGKKSDVTMPAAIAIITFGSNPNFNFNPIVIIVINA